MLYVLIGTGLFFVAIGYILTENNARYLMAGYNTLSDGQRRKVDIKAYVAYFKKYHIFLGVSMVMIGWPMYLVEQKAMGIFLAIYPILAYIYFIWRSRKYIHGSGMGGNNFVIVILSGTLIFVLVLLSAGLREDRLVVDGNKITIQGYYGEVFLPSDIESVTLVDRPPEIKLKINGFALGNIHKGYFRTRNGETVKLILNSENRPLILIVRKSGEKVYFSADSPSQAVFQKIQASFPQIARP